MFNDRLHESNPRRVSVIRFLGAAWLAVWLSAAAWYGLAPHGRGEPIPVPSEHLSPVGFRSVDSSPSGRSRPVRTRRIEELRVGDRVVTKISDDVREQALAELSGRADWDSESAIDAATWGVVELEMPKADGGRYKFTLLRPLKWIDALAARPGVDVAIAIPEQGLNGVARVLSVAACPPIKAGDGRIVTGTFTHVRNGILKIYLDGNAEPLGVTENHRIYRADQREFALAGKIPVGARLVGIDGRDVRVTAIVRVPGAERVYNLEVNAEHVFRVTSSGLLVHNNSAYVPGEYLAGKAPRQVTPGIRELEGQYVNDLGRVEPWRAHYDEFGRLIGRTDFNAGNVTDGIPDVHHHTYQWGPGMIPLETGSHIPGEFVP